VQDKFLRVNSPEGIESHSPGIQERFPHIEKFAWQAGYGAFSVSASNLQAVRTCIGKQAQHHARVSFQDEFRAFLEKHGVAFDERYVWD
jgi:hypothetical protein